MNFYKSTKNRDYVLPQGAELPCVVYIVDNWDDYNFETLYHLCLFKKSGGKEVLGDVKILQTNSRNTKIPDSFPSLGPEFFSLGQDLEYYENMRKHLPKTHRKVLDALNDVVVKPQLLDEIETSSGFRNSLIRFNDAKLALRDGLATLEERPLEKGYRFMYSGKIPGAEEGVSIDVDLQPDDPVPGRILAIIGRNGVGKTQFFSPACTRPCDDKAGVDRDSQPSRVCF